MLTDPERGTRPFAWFRCQGGLPDALVAWLEAGFEREQRWERHTDSFYKALIADVSEGLDAGLREGLVRRMEALTGLPLGPRVKLTIQRMEPGWYALPHTDQPQAGYEAARLVLHLNRDWGPDEGGALCLHPDAGGQDTTHRLVPVHGQVFGFVMGPTTVHSVEPCARARRAAVFNFWHRGNGEALAEQVEGLFEGMRFDALPGAVGRRLAEAELHADEEDSFRAGAVAWVGSRLGLGEAELVEAVEAGLSPLSAPEGSRGVLLARWLERLHHQGFEAGLWATLAPRLQGWRESPVPLAFPG